MKRFSSACSKLVVFALIMIVALPAWANVVFPGKTPGAPSIDVNKTGISLGNKVLRASWEIDGRSLKPGRFTNKITGKAIDLGDSLFQIALADGRVIDSSKCELVAFSSFPFSKLPLVYMNQSQLAADPNSPRAGDHFAGRQIEARLIDQATGLEITWRATLREGANYIRQEFDLFPKSQDVAISTITLFDSEWPEARVSGPASGSPLASPTAFASIEDPMSSGTLTAGRAQSILNVGIPIRQGQHFVRGSVIGVSPEGQLRRAFLCYLERERAHPYRPFLHYNSWWDLGIDPTKPRHLQSKDFTETECLDRIEAFNRELVEKRGVVLDSFLFDDGWDNVDTVWEFNKYFPDGLANLAAATTRCNSGIGIWLSPFGGYRWKHDRRMIAGKKAGMEENKAGFALSGANYYNRFLTVTTEMIKKYNVNMFKFDGISRNTIAPPNSPFSSDFQAAQQLLKELRKARKDVFINLTTGTWASPFWTLLADSIWRGGEDCDKMGVGSERQRMMTYRDALVYTNIRQQCALYPLNSLMVHGVVWSYAMMPTDPYGDVKPEARSFFGSGTNLQELYIRPSLLKDSDWDIIAEAAKWGRAKADVLVDTHWIGGDPNKLEVYGWAAWTPQGATLTLRNPSDKPQEITVDAQSAFELPKGARKHYEMKSPYKDQRIQALSLSGSKQQTISLQPFEVVVLEGQGKRFSW
ncbi:enterotoxin [bacterium]|nr:enterotoxin [bacterium]